MDVTRFIVHAGAGRKSSHIDDASPRMEWSVRVITAEN